MNRQLNYIINGFLLALAIPITGFVIRKFSFSPAVSDNSIVTITDQPIRAASPLSAAAAKGKAIFMQKCAACHSPWKAGTGPSICGFEERGAWSDRENLYSWIRNPAEFMKQDPYTRGLKEEFGSLMTAFPEITDEEVDNIVAFIDEVCKKKSIKF